MKKYLLSILAVSSAIFFGALIANAAPITPVSGGGTQTSTKPLSGQTLIGNSGGTYTPAYITCSSGCTVTTSSAGIAISVAGAGGTVTFLANGGTFVSTSTINFQAGTNITIGTSSTGTYIINSTGGGSGVASTSPFTVANLVVVSSSGALSTISSGTYYLSTNPSGFITTSTYNASTSIATVSPLAGGGAIVNGGTLTLTCTTCVTTTTGNWSGTWQGVNSTTFYLATNPNGYISNITGLINSTGTNITVSGLGTVASPFIINSTGGGIATTTPYVNGNITVASGTGLSTFTGSTCGGSTFQNGISASGTALCGTPAGGSSSTNVFGTNGVTTTQTGVNATASLDTTYAASWSALETFLKGATINGTTTLASTTNALVLTNGTGVVAAYTGTTCGAGAAPNGFSAIGAFTGCITFLQGNQTITLTGAVTGSGATTIATTFTTSTLYGLFSAGTGISFGSTTGVITNTGVTSAVAGGCVTVSNATGTVTFGSTCLTGTKVDSLNSITGAVIVAGTGPIVVASSSQTITVSCPTCGTGSGTVTTSSAGTANTLPIWTSGSALGNSGISQNGTSTYINNSSTYLGTNSSTTTSSLIWVSNYTGAGYWDATGTPMSVSSCGTSPTIVGNMDRSRLVVGSGIVASCTLTFPIAFKNVPSVLMSGESSISGLAYTPTTSTLTITGTSLTSDAIDLSVEGIGE